MRAIRLIIKKAGVAVLVITLFLLVKGDMGRVMAEILSKGNVLYGFVVDEKEDGFTGKTIINCYMPVVGYVDSHYMDNKFVNDPSYVPVSQIEYIDIGDEGTLEEGSLAAQSINAQEDNGQTGADNIDIQNNMPEENSSNAQENINETSSSGLTNLYTKNELMDFNSLLSKYYTVTSITELKEDKFDVVKALDADMTLQGDNSQPQILIFHTHSQETFVDSVEGDPSTSIVGVGAHLAKVLSSEYGYNVIHDTSVYDYVNGKLDRSKAYTYAEAGVAAILEKYPSIEVVLDVHRDGVDESIRLVTDINGKPTAKMMFFNGISYTKVNGDIDYLQNPYVQDNLTMSLRMYLLGSSRYPDLLRKNYINAYRYCLHFRAKSMLIEVGAQNNTLQEELNAMDVLAETLDRLFKGEKGYE